MKMYLYVHIFCQYKLHLHLLEFYNIPLFSTAQNMSYLYMYIYKCIYCDT